MAWLVVENGHQKIRVTIEFELCVLNIDIILS